MRFADPSEEPAPDVDEAGPVMVRHPFEENAEVEIGRAVQLLAAELEAAPTEEQLATEADLMETREWVEDSVRERQDLEERVAALEEYNGW